MVVQAVKNAEKPNAVLRGQGREEAGQSGPILFRGQNLDKFAREVPGQAATGTRLTKD